jgi:hypothetical protein
VFRVDVPRNDWGGNLGSVGVSETCH